MPLKKRNIACLESLWDDTTEDRLNVVPMLEIISKLWGAKYSHLNCNTRAELKYNLNLLRRRNYGILYLAFQVRQARFLCTMAHPFRSPNWRI